MNKYMKKMEDDRRIEKNWFEMMRKMNRRMERGNIKQYKME